MRHGTLILVAEMFVMAGVGCVTGCAARSRTLAALSHSAPRLTHGVASGDVTARSAVLWARCDRDGHLGFTMHDAAGHIAATAGVEVSAAHDFTGSVAVDGLHPDTDYRYEAACSSSGGTGASEVAQRGILHTAPAAESATAVRFAWSGDLAGQNVCRDRATGYRIFTTITEQHPAFFIALGDMVYADSPCTTTGRYGNHQVPGPQSVATTLPEFWAYWKYNRDDDIFRRFLAAIPSYAVWDDHEVRDDFGPRDDCGRLPPSPPTRHLLPLGRQAFLDYNPIRIAADDPVRLFRSVRWGKHLEIFFLDTRQYRDLNSDADDAPQPKSLLGPQQRAWLLEQLRRSDATWKVIVSSVPLSVPTGTAEHGRDGWANFDQRTGFERELIEILQFTHTHGINNQIWISTDIHFAEVFRDTPFTDDPSFHLYEVDTGPLNSGVFPKVEYDDTLHPERLFRFPESGEPTGGFEQAQTWFNFGMIEIGADGALTIGVMNAAGRRLYQVPLRPQ